MECSVLHADAFEDNYIWLVTPEASNSVSPKPTLIIDPGDEDPVLEKIDQENLTPVAVLCTHHHGDHVGGASALATQFNIPVYGPRLENIAAVTNPVDDGDHLAFPDLGLEFTVMAVPGHTRGHVAYYTPGMLFCGDTLFSAGCGRLFEGTAEQMLHSLNRLAALPDETKVYCAHEYTAANLRFASTVEPDNQAVRLKISEVTDLRSQNNPSLPSRIDIEKQINPFLRASLPTVNKAAEAHVGHALADPLATFTELRRWKDHFLG
ncbi:MAG: hydroxyacylglutathione hydrolase [Thiotrichales bacterium SG8_50]|jgi:hydroxyacylglutathione hydrolase|nr:MAG: hydroxyacylglutathione hydrolase [Thiotrichales bacterium SG8_50]